jgi:hypothetical protein
MQWYEYPRIDNYGFYPDPFGPYAKPDSNIECGAGIDVTSLASGVISGVVHSPNWGIGTDSVTIRLDKPINAIATHMAYNFITASAKVGDKVVAGTIIGKSTDTFGFGLAFALTADEEYGDGTFAKYNGDKRLDPVPVLEAAKKDKPLPVQGTSNSTGIDSSVYVLASVVIFAIIGIVLFVGFVGIQS